MAKKRRNDDDRIQWRKIGGGTFRFNNKIIKSGQVFEARVEEIPENFRDTIIPLDVIGALKKDKKNKKGIKNAKGNDFKMKERAPGWWDVVDNSGKVKNENGMRKKEAQKLVDSLLKSG